MSDATKKTRTVSEETQIRKLLVDLTDRILKMNEENVAQTKMLVGRFNDIDHELQLLKRSDAKTRRAVDAVAMLAGDALKKVNDLHQRQIGTADKFGQRLHDLEKHRSAPNRGTTPRRPTR